MTEESTRPSKTSWSYIPRIFPYLRPYWRLGIVVIVLVIVGSVVGMLLPWPLALLVDNVLTGQPLPAMLERMLGPLAASPMRLLIFLVGAGLGLTLLSNAIALLDSYINTKLEQGMVLDCRSDMFQNAQRLSLAFYDKSRTGALMFRINNQASSVGSITTSFPPLAQNAIMLVGMFWIVASIDLVLALLAMTVVPFLYYSVVYYTNHIEDRIKRVRSMEARSLVIIHEAISMLKVIVAFGREGYEYRRFREQGETAVDARVKLTVRQTFFSLVVNGTTAVGTALVVGYGGYSVMQGTLTVGQLLVVLAYLSSVYGPLAAISTTIGTLQERLVGLRMAFELLEEEPEVKDAPDAREIRRARGDLTFEGVHFSYKTRENTLNDISFRVHAGQAVAIVGPTGAGKSTLVSLIPRFYDPDQGRIMLDGIDIRQISLSSLRDQISVVLQEPLLFSGTIADNIRYGRLDAGKEEIIEAAKAANAHDFIQRLPKKYETVLGERGAQLSGGERQRISVARAFLKDAPVLILDEPTASIDSRTENVILDALDRLMVGRTTIMIAHRLSTIRHADIILVLDHGELVEQGTHAELVENGGLYQQLHEVQTRQRRGKREPAAAGAGPRSGRSDS
jgi:ATP-binding cassette, subfamily B, bacterial